MAHLDVLEGFQQGYRFALPDEAVIGRILESFLCLPESQVSRQHARLRRYGASFVIEDLQSANGVVLQGKRLLPQVPYDLHDGDEIVICSTRMVFRTTSHDPDVAPPRPDTAPSPLPSTAPLTRRMARDEVENALRLRMLADETEQPEVALTLDASVDMLEISEAEKHTDRGLQEALKRLQAMAQVSAALGTILDRPSLLHKIITCLFAIFPAAERAVIMLGQPDGTLVPTMAQVRAGSAAPVEEVAMSRTIIQEVMQHRRSILSHDALDDARFNQNLSVMDLCIRSMMCAPLLVNEEILGLMHVDTSTTPCGFTAEDLQVFTGISTQAAIAIKNLQLREAIATETARRLSLQRYFSPGLVDMLMSGDVTADLGGNAYHGTILLADIIGFTAMSEKLPPAQVVAKLNRYFTVMQKVIYDQRGNVDKFHGDGLMAFWGVPRAGAHDESDAVRAALGMQRKLWPFNLQLCAEGQQPVHMGIGLNSGEFIAGNIGSEDKIDFTLIGDTVNLTARIEQLAGRYQVLVSEATWTPIQDTVCAVRLPATRVKGKAHPVTLYSIRAIHDSEANQCLVVLPCQVLSATGQSLGHGLLIASVQQAQGHHLLMHTTLPLQAGDTVTLHGLMPECDTPLEGTARVASTSTISQDSAWPYTRALLTLTGCHPLTTFLTHGSCLDATQNWRPARA
ncbi:MAG: FHA domain-containing protein [Candidatus Tectomicrobia bacterium]|uniref:FHA domain-containing protein n=1 Tax=Tectimicrobiota bacterium TaxID=2528274 RepID=A0A937W288_UNCTE|nr:FHA domain-containing protein [Candidatus Tectomicrobia bacterium]